MIYCRHVMGLEGSVLEVAVKYVTNTKGFWLIYSSVLEATVTFFGG